MREQKEQEKQNELLRVVAEQNHERLIEYDVKEDRAVVYAIENDRFEVLFDIEDYVKKNHYGSVFIDPEDKKVFRRAMHACLQKEGTVTVDVRYCEKENQPEWYRFYLVSIAEEDGKTDRMVGRFCCVQQEKAITERMRRRAEIDVLTNVYNHKAFEEYCAKELAECTTNALFVMLDIDDFKMINDTQGHAVGDMVLSQTGSILSEVTGDRGIVGRLGGDEFAVFASGFQNSVEMEEFCVSLRENLKKIIFDMEYSVSIGAAKLDGRRISFPDFYYEADRAVYAAKRGGKNRIVFYDQIKENQEPETADPVEPILAQGNEKSMLRQLRTCMEALGSDGIGDALMQTFEALRQYFDADCVVLAYAKEGGIRYVEECHRDTAQMMARLVTEEIESGDAEGVIQEIGQLGDVVIPDIKSLRESHPVIYEYLAELRAWSAAGISLYTGDHLLGILMVLNPHRHLEEADVLSMLGTTLAARIELRNLQEQQEYDRTHDKLTGLWNREGLSVMARTGADNMFCSLGVITTDVIHLSEINKQFGYISGNRRLMEVAELLKSLFPNYRIYRYDEDEMLVLCINIKRQEMELCKVKGGRWDGTDHRRIWNWWNFICGWYRGCGRARKSSAIDCGGIEYGSSGKRIRQCGTGCGGRSCFSGHAGTVFAVQTGTDYADDRGLGKRRLLMKELIRQYAGTAIAVVTALVLIALVSEMSVVVEKGIPKSGALCETDTGAFEGYWRSR